MRLLVTSLIMTCSMSLSFGQTISAQAGVAGADFSDALGAINGGYAADVIELATDGGFYELSAADSVTVPLTIRAAAGLAVKPTIRVAVGDTIGRYLKVWADLTVENVIFDGKRSDGSLNAFTSKDVVAFAPNPVTGTQENTPRMDVTFKGCEFYDVSEDGSGGYSGKANAIRLVKENTDAEDGVKALYGVLTVEDCHFENIYDEVILAQKVSGTDDPAIRAADSVYVRNTTFNNCAGPDNQGIICWKGAKGAQVLTAVLTLENLTFYNSNPRTIYSRESENFTVRNILIANTNPLGKAGTLINIDRDGSSISYIDTTGIDTTGMSAVVMFTGGPGESTGFGNATIDSTTIFGYDPGFADAANGDLTIGADSPVCGIGYGGQAISDLNWATACAVNTSVDDNVYMADSFQLHQAYPNPFNPSTTIGFSLDNAAQVKLNVYDLRGALIATLVNNNIEAGYHSVNFNSNDAAAGVYLYTMTVNGQTYTRKMVLLK